MQALPWPCSLEIIYPHGFALCDLWAHWGQEHCLIDLYVLNAHHRIESTDSAQQQHVGWVKVCKKIIARSHWPSLWGTELLPASGKDWHFCFALGYLPSDRCELPGPDVNKGLDPMSLPGVLALIPDHHGATNLEQTPLRAATGYNLSCPFQTIFKEVPAMRQTVSEGSVTWETDQRENCHRHSSLHPECIIWPLTFLSLSFSLSEMGLMSIT